MNRRRIGRGRGSSRTNNKRKTKKNRVNGGRVGDAPREVNEPTAERDDGTDVIQTMPLPRRHPHTLLQRVADVIHEGGEASEVCTKGLEIAALAVEEQGDRDVPEFD